MIDVVIERLLPLAEIAKLLPPARLGRPVSFQCILRWVLSGTKSPSGELIKLEAIRLGGRWVSSREALQRFADALTPPSDPLPAANRTLRQRRLAADRAEKALDDMGV